MRVFRMIYASRRTGRHKVAPTASAVGTGYVLRGLYVVLPRADTEIGPYNRMAVVLCTLSAVLYISCTL